MQRLIAQLRAFRVHARIFRSCSNYRSVIKAMRRNSPWPPICFRNGTVVEHGPRDRIDWKFFDIVVRQVYTGAGFYRPRNGDRVIDIGANVGMFSLYMRSLCTGVQCRCFEPSASTFGRLRRNIELNAAKGEIEIVPAAVGEIEGTADLFQSAQSGANSLRAESTSSDAVSSETVRVLSLNDAIGDWRNEKIQLLKMDVEGSEIEIVGGATAEIMSGVQRVAFEYHDAFRPGCKEITTCRLRAFGFKVVAIDGDASQGVVRMCREGSR